MQNSSPIILVVEDEVLIRMDVADQLACLGYNTFEASSGQEALNIIAREGRVDIVFTDVDMPGKVDGISLARKVNSDWPTTGIIVTSGQTTISPDTFPTGSRFYSKPFNAMKIQTVIEELLA